MNPFDPKLPAIASDAKVKTCHVFHCFHAMRKMGQSFRRDVFANFAGLNIAHVDAIIAALEAHNALPRLVEERKPQARGSRLPEGWEAPDEYIQWAITERYWTLQDAQKEAAIFADYWTGQGTTKIDWLATWRNWVRRSNREDGPRPQGGTADPKMVLKAKISHWERNHPYEEDDAQVKAWRDELASNVVQLRAGGAS